MIRGDGEYFTEFKSDLLERGTSEEIAIEQKWLERSRFDPESFEFFCRKYYDAIFRYIYRRVPDADVASALANETFFQAYDKLYQYRNRGLTFDCWLFRIAVSRLSRYYKDRRRIVEVVFDAERDSRTAVRSPLDELTAREDAELLYWCLHQLTEAEQNLLVLCCIEGYPPRQVAKYLDVPSETVRARLLRARKRMAVLLNSPRMAAQLSQQGDRARRTLLAEARGLRVVDGE